MIVFGCEKSSRSARIYFATPRDEKNCKVCLMTEKESK